MKKSLAGPVVVTYSELKHKTPNFQLLNERKKRRKGKKDLNIKLCINFTRS